MSTNIVVPELGESVVEARVSRWLKKEGDRVSVGETLVELETDKIDLEVGATQGGVLASIRHGDGEDVGIGDVLGVIEDAADGEKTAEGKEAADEKDAVREGEAADGEEAAEEEAAAAGERSEPKDRPEPGAASERAAREPATPAGRQAAASESRRAERPAGSRRPGRPPAVARPAPESARPAASSGGRLEERVRMSKRRQTIARRLVEAQRTAAMLTTFNEIDMTAVMSLRARHKQGFKDRHGVGLGIASFFVKASVTALKAFPRLNAEVQGEEMVLKHYYDIGIAVGAAEGLVVPVLRDADAMSFAAIERSIREFARKADEGTLTLEDLRGGTFTITNGGVFGSLLSTPILNPPQVGILGLHKIDDRAVPLRGQVAIRPMMFVALSYDHRIVDGREAVLFLVRVKDLVEDPASMLLDG